MQRRAENIITKSKARKANKQKSNVNMLLQQQRNQMKANILPEIMLRQQKERNAQLRSMRS